MKVFRLQAPIYRGAWLSSRLTAQTSQLAAVRRDALERWRRARSRGLSAEEAARAEASPSTWRSHPSRVPLNHQPGDRPVSHGLNSDMDWRPAPVESKLGLPERAKSSP
jgi:hypothetical protein